jgi:hypothetical protein
VAAAAETRFTILRKPFALSELERVVRDAMTGGSNPIPRRVRS